MLVSCQTLCHEKAASPWWVGHVLTRLAARPTESWVCHWPGGVCGCIPGLLSMGSGDDHPRTGVNLLGGNRAWEILNLALGYW